METESAMKPLLDFWKKQSMILMETQSTIKSLIGIVGKQSMILMVTEPTLKTLMGTLKTTEQKIVKINSFNIFVVL